MRTKLLLLFFALGEITASAQTDSLPNITKTSNGKLIDPIQIHEVVVTGTRNETRYSSFAYDYFRHRP